MTVSYQALEAMPGFIPGTFTAGCPARVVLDHVTSKWGVLVLLALTDGTRRWSELRREVPGISEKMLASTLRTLEADGLVLRDAYPTIPPRVDYSLTERGAELAEAMMPLVLWVAGHAGEIVAGAPTSDSSISTEPSAAVAS